MADSKCKQQLSREAAKSFGNKDDRLSSNRSMHIARYVTRGVQKKSCTPVKKKN
jgi:hypothetical protein